MTMTRANALQISYTPSSTVEITLDQKLREVVSVKDFGAVGDGVTDDTAALTAAAAYVSSGNKLLRIPSGTYLHEGAWAITGNNLIIEGDGAGTVIINTNTTTNLSRTMRVVGSNNTVRNFAIDGRKNDISGALTERIGVWVEGDYPTIENIHVYDTLTAGLFVFNGRGAIVRGNVIRDVGFFGGNQNALGIVVSTFTQATIVNNAVYNTARSGIFAYESSRVVMSGNTVDGCENGLRFDAVDKDQDSFSVITGNVATGGTGDGIRFTGSRVTVSGNLCRGNAGSGASSGGGVDQTISGNTFVGNTQNGIRVGQEDGPTTRITITGNLCTGNAANGVFFANTSVAVTDAHVVGNNLIGNTSTSLRLTATSAPSTLTIGENAWVTPQLAASGWSVSGPGIIRNSITADTTITVTGCGVHGVSGTADIDNITLLPAGNWVILYFVNTAAGSGVRDGAGNLRLAGNFAYAPNATLHLVSGGSTWLEVSRSLN